MESEKSEGEQADLLLLQCCFVCEKSKKKARKIQRFLLHSSLHHKMVTNRGKH